MSLRVNVYMSKIMCKSIKLGVYTYTMYANCQSLGVPEQQKKYLRNAGEGDK